MESEEVKRYLIKSLAIERELTHTRNELSELKYTQSIEERKLNECRAKFAKVKEALEKRSTKDPALGLHETREGIKRLKEKTVQVNAQASKTDAINHNIEKQLCKLSAENRRFERCQEIIKERRFKELQQREDIAAEELQEGGLLLKYSSVESLPITAVPVSSNTKTLHSFMQEENYCSHNMESGTSHSEPMPSYHDFVGEISKLKIWNSLNTSRGINFEYKDSTGEKILVDLFSLRADELTVNLSTASKAKRRELLSVRSRIKQSLAETGYKSKIDIIGDSGAEY